MWRSTIALVVILLGVGVFAGSLAWLLDTPKPPPGASRVERLYLGLCATCHGADGRGSWRAALFLIRPGTLAEVRRSGLTDQYLFDIIKHGGAPLGRPGMPAFGASFSDDDIRALVTYIQRLGRTTFEPLKRRLGRRTTSPPTAEPLKRRLGRRTISPPTATAGKASG